jgi:hypothetical protein
MHSPDEANICLLWSSFLESAREENRPTTQEEEEEEEEQARCNYETHC